MNPKSPNPTDVYVGARMRMQRMVLGMSQETLAGHLGITFQQVQKYEKGTNRIGASRLQIIARILGVPINFFFQQEQHDPLTLEGIARPEQDLVSTFLGSREGLNLNKGFLKIRDSKTRKSIIALIKAMAKGDEEQAADLSTDAISDTDHLH